ncbi:plasmid recombination enzyme [Escherichia coli]|uniref:MobV family relaxase n=4 Tax=Enterobacteriaceae TaxID=543 RepID=UPI00098C3DA8|nr:MobV family relaxase [Escherichia coli]EDX1456812.1 plasmid recombination enzyme [Salmonella enterica subsp. enterica serovar Hadar]EEC7202932.1 plasmid recombination enzyme [Escherichia coli O11]RXY78885.1 plasmid recombination enzyme [Klebsiella pneumoniae]EEC9286318.1 plasmid recombination enzyme [Escherichia coli]EEC9415025.1 plasmid recombination enzyme [Escherichia coli]
MRSPDWLDVRQNEGVSMANYAIMRCKKLTGMGSVASALQHCYRERETPNADAERTPENYCSVSQSADEAMGKLRELLPEKRRKDAVLAVEYVMTASPEWWNEATPRQQAEFFARSEQWLENKYGKDRVVAAVVHRDEATPHLSAFVVPLTQDGRLSAKEFIGGRSKMRDDQSTYAESVKKLGLERGIEGSRATHQTVQHYYESINRGTRSQVSISPEALEPRVLRKGIFTKDVEDQAAIAKRLSQAVNDGFAGTIAMASQSAQNAKRARDLQKTMDSQQKRLQSVTEPFKGLSREQMTHILTMAQTFQQQNHDRKKQRQLEREQERQQRQKTDRGISR